MAFRHSVQSINFSSTVYSIGSLSTDSFGQHGPLFSNYMFEKLLESNNTNILLLRNRCYYSQGPYFIVNFHCTWHGEEEKLECREWINGPFQIFSIALVTRFHYLACWLRYEKYHVASTSKESEDADLISPYTVVNFLADRWYCTLSASACVA